ncbi:MAG: hypothetical protein DRP45_07805 [Candidatus Zixiibacteriota bacterium]|nr:MAG: hypothetical protein DRP45_07805 [candidate division Zixibacteria bacterium]
MSGYVDLHIHTVCSDGTRTPEEILRIVREKRLVAFSITDHDTLEGYRQTYQYLKNGDPELVPGVELSAIENGEDMHMLAYMFDPDNRAFNDCLEEFQETRRRRGRLMVEKLNALGLEITFEAVEMAAGSTVIGRSHVAEVLVQLGHVSTFDEAFWKYIGTEGPAYVPKSKITPADAIKLVHGAGGVAVLAHPFIGEAHQHIEGLAGIGLDGIEAYHYSHRNHQVTLLKSLAKRYGLFITGGSDYHGRQETEGEIGALQVPANVLENMKQKAANLR